MKDHFWPSIWRTTSSMLSLQRMSTSWMTSRLWVKFLGSTSLSMRVTEWRIKNLNLLSLLVSNTSRLTEFFWLAPLSKITWASFGLCLTSFCQRFSHLAKNSKSGSISHWARFIRWQIARLLTTRSKHLNSLRKSSFSLSIVFTRSFVPSF